MISLAILICMVIILTIIAIALISIGGSIFLVMFGDVLICIGVILWIIKKRFQK